MIKLSLNFCFNFNLKKQILVTMDTIITANIVSSNYTTTYYKISKVLLIITEVSILDNFKILGK